MSYFSGGFSSEPVAVIYGVLTYIIPLPDQRWEIRAYFRVFYLWLELMPEIVLFPPFVLMREKGKTHFVCVSLLLLSFSFV